MADSSAASAGHPQPAPTVAVAGGDPPVAPYVDPPADAVDKPDECAPQTAQRPENRKSPQHPLPNGP
ncbi:hypothetical protein GUJ93_ZPchr0006g40842 [Zizania palustris]|uniref:Uncharacterized protein n=1 Tax=Zizania palustris TaxID=103762 RepID=A0A8J5VWV2_ZIZPA|nr:hypothetical protein GUJ93_ZPchr0006g40842 [Zizania palustris]